MKPAPRARALALLVAAFGLPPRPVVAQDVCPRASGAEAEAGWSAYGEGDMDEARARFTAAIDRCPNDHYARTGLGYVLLRDGDTAAATGLWRTVVAAQPNNVDALTGLGLAAWRLGDLDTVRERFAHVLDLVPDHPTALEYAARAEGAEAAADHPSDPADEAWDAGDTARASALYRQRLENDPEDEIALLRVGLMRAWQGEYDEALALLNRLIEAGPGNLDARVARARVLAWSGDIPAAQREAVEVLAVQPDHPEALEALTLFQIWAGEVEEALSSYDELISIVPGRGSAGRQRAQALAWAARFEASRSAYDALLARDPTDVEARLGLARTLAYAQQFDDALAEYDRILADSPGEVRALVGKARTLGWAGRLVEGERVALQAVDVDGSMAAAWGALGGLYRWQGRNAAAKAVLERVAELAPTNAEVLDQLRSVDLALAPFARPTVVYEDDSDGNRMMTTALNGSWHPVARLDVRASGYYKDLEQQLFSRTASGVFVSATYHLEPGWKLSLGSGGSHNDGTVASSLFEYEAEIETPRRYPVVGRIGFRSRALNETAALAELGGRAVELLLTGTWQPTLDWRIDGSVSVGRYEGTEHNGRRSASLSTSRRVGRFFSLGAAARGFSFEKNLDDGYFDPDFYGVAELTGYWLYRPGAWTLLVEVAPGLQQVRTEGDVGASWRSNARVAYRFAPGREVSLSFGYSSAGLTTFATGASDYRYTVFIMGTRWVF